MRTASSRIWSPTTNSQQTNKSNLPLIQIRSGNPPAGIDQLIMDPQVGLSNGSGSRSHGYSGQRFPTGSESKHLLVDGYTQLVTDRVQAGWTCDLVSPKLKSVLTNTYKLITEVHFYHQSIQAFAPPTIIFDRLCTTSPD
jgi:hypothetical protein